MKRTMQKVKHLLYCQGGKYPGCLEEDLVTFYKYIRSILLTCQATSLAIAASIVITFVCCYQWTSNSTPFTSLESPHQDQPPDFVLSLNQYIGLSNSEEA